MRNISTVYDISLSVIIWKKVEEYLRFFKNLRRKSIFSFSHEWFAKIDKFLGPNDTMHEIDISERAYSPLSDDAKQNSV